MAFIFSEKYQVVTDLEQSKPDYFIISTVLYEYFMTWCKIQISSKRLSRSLYRQTDIDNVEFLTNKKTWRVQAVTEGRVNKFMLSKLVDFSLKWVGGVLLVH